MAKSDATDARGSANWRGDFSKVEWGRSVKSQQLTEGQEEGKLV